MGFNSGFKGLTKMHLLVYIIWLEQLLRKHDIRAHTVFVTLGIGTSDGVLWRRLWNFRIHPNTCHQVGFSQYSFLGHGPGDGLPRPSPCPSGIYWGVSNPRLILSSLSNSWYRRTLCHVRFEVSKALVTVITIFCCMTPCSLLMCTNLRRNTDDASSIFPVSAMYSVQ